MATSKVNPDSFVPENSNFRTAEEALNETRARAKYLAKFIKSNPKSHVTKETRDIAWKIHKSYADWRYWRKAVATVLSEEGYPGVALTLIKIIIGPNKAPTNKDDASFKLARNLFGSLAHFSDYGDFRQQLIKSGAIETIMGFLAQESNKKKQKSNEPGENNFLLRSGLQVMLNILMFTDSANDLAKFGATNIFANMMDCQEDELKCLSALCLLQLLDANNGNKSNAAGAKFVDDKDIHAAVLKMLKAELSSISGNNNDRQREFKIPIDPLVDALIFLSQNEVNIKKLLQGGIVETMCRLLDSSTEGINLRGVELFLALFADRLKVAQTALSAEEFDIVWKKCFSLNSNTVETMPVLKARKILTTLKQMRNGQPSESTRHSTKLPKQESQDSNKSQHTNSSVGESSATAVNEDSVDVKTDETTNFKDNEVIHLLDNAMAETRLRVNFLAKLYQLSPTSIVCSESLRAVELLSDSFSAWQSKWEKKIIQVLEQEKYEEVSMNYASFLLKQDLNSDDTAKRILFALYLHICNITDASPDIRKAFGRVGFVQLLLNYLKSLQNNNESRHKSANSNTTTNELIQKTIFMLYNLSRSSDQKPIFIENDATNILAKYLGTPNLVLLTSLCLAHIVSDSPESAKLVEEREVIKTILELVNVAVWEPGRKAYVPDVGLFTFEELMEGLCHLAVNDTNKQTLLNSGVLKLLNELLTSNNSNEQISGMELMWTLCYEPSVRAKIRADEKELMTPLKNLTLSDDKEVQRSAKRTVDFIEKWDRMTSANGQLMRSSKARDLPSKKKGAASNKGGHVFISYSWKQQDTVLKLKNALIARGYRVWIDVERMKGDLLESMSQAVENASVVLICFSHSYKLSNPCRAEAEYAYTLSKPIVPINMEYHYFPDGWLGILVLARKFIDMSLEKRPFEDAVEQLNQEISSVLKHSSEGETRAPLAATISVPVATTSSSPPTTTTNHHANQQQQQHGTSSIKLERNGVSRKPSNNIMATSHTIVKNSVAKWTKDDVKKWLQQEKLSEKFADKMEDFDGEKLSALLNIEKKAPEYYYTAVSRHFNETLPNLLELFAAFGRLSSQTGS